MSAPKKNGRPEDIITDRAGGLDLYKESESTKWRHMIKKDAAIDLNNIRSHIRRFRNTQLISDSDLLIHDATLSKPAAMNEAVLAGGKDAKVFPKLGLGPVIPKSINALTPEEFEKTKNSIGGIKVVKGDKISQKHLKARLKRMEKTLKIVRKERKLAENELNGLQRHLNLPMSPSANISAPPSGRIEVGKKGNMNKSISTPQLTGRSNALSITSARKQIMSARSNVSRRSNTPNASNRSRRSSKSKPQYKEVKVWNKRTKVWEPKKRKMGKFGLPDTSESFRSQNIGNLFISPDSRGMTTTNQIGLVAITDLIRRGVVDPNLYLKIDMHQKDSRCPKIMSPITKFAEHAVRNRLKPFALGRG